MTRLKGKSGNPILPYIHVCDGTFAISYIESEQNFMHNNSEDDLISSVRNACKHMCIT